MTLATVLWVQVGPPPDPPAVRGGGEVRSRSWPQSAPVLLSAGHSCCMLARSSVVMEKLVHGLMWMLLFPSCTCYGRNVLLNPPRLKAEIVHVCGFVRGSAGWGGFCCWSLRRVPQLLLSTVPPGVSSNARLRWSEHFLGFSSCVFRCEAMRRWGRLMLGKFAGVGCVPLPQLCRDPRLSALTCAQI